MTDRPSTVDAVTSGDLLFFWQSTNGAYRTASMATFLKFLNGALDLPGQKTTQYLNPTATGWSAQVTKANTWLVLAPTAATAAGTITLPSGPVDQSEVLVTSTQAITALTVASAEDAVVGAPTSLPANGYFTMRFDDIMKTWRRVG